VSDVIGDILIRNLCLVGRGCSLDGLDTSLVLMLAYELADVEHPPWTYSEVGHEGYCCKHGQNDENPQDAANFQVTLLVEGLHKSDRY
jgi:hypothetical protein